MDCPHCEAPGLIVTHLTARPGAPDEQRMCCVCGYTETVVVPMPDPFAPLISPLLSPSDEPDTDVELDLDPEE